MAQSKAQIEKAAKIEFDARMSLAERQQREHDTHQSKINSSADLFKNTRVTSCSQVLQKNGKAVCLAFNNCAPKTSEEKQTTDLVSFSQDHYKVREHLHAGMMKKPLEPYHPNAFRSRLPQPTVVMPYKNSSSIVIGDRSTYYKRQFLSTNQNLYGEPKQFASTNPGIIST